MAAFALLEKPLLGAVEGLGITAGELIRVACGQALDARDAQQAAAAKVRAASSARAARSERGLSLSIFWAGLRPTAGSAQLTSVVQ